MDILNNIEWYFGKPKDAINKDTYKKITKKELKTVVFEEAKNSITFCFPLNDDFTVSENRELKCPITVEQLLNFLSKFYNEPLTQDIVDKAYDDFTDRYEDISNLTKYNLFDDTCTPDFCGIHPTDEGYFVNIGPE